MKVRHKRNIDDRIYDDCIAVGEWYIQETHGIAGHHKAFHNSDYEPVIEDRWQDVTGECQVVEGVSGQQYVNHGEHYFGVVNYTPSYRLRKVQVVSVEPETAIECTTPLTFHRWLLENARPAFLVERKVSE